MYQPVLSKEEWETGKLPSFGVYHSLKKAKEDYPKHTIAAYLEGEIEEPTYMDDNIEQRKQAAIDQAMNYLCDNETTHDGQRGSIRAQVEAIANWPNQACFIDEVDDVIVWEKVVYTFTCDEFLQMIEWPE